jgi:hypothetical protein
MWFLSVAEEPQGLENPTFFLVSTRREVGFLLFMYHYLTLIIRYTKIEIPRTKGTNNATKKHSKKIYKKSY